MKKFIFTIYVLLFSYVAVFSQNVIDKPFIKFDTTVYDVGTLKLNEKVEKTYYFTNKGNEPILIFNVQTTCGCTASEWSKQPVLSGKRGYVKLRYEADKTGNFSKTAYVFSNAKNSPVELKIKGKVVKN
jgi:hypothetical protein